MLKRAYGIIAISLLLAACLGGCSAQVAEDTNPQTTATVVITHDFGREVALEQGVEIGADTRAMAALQMVADVETKYGGGFVNAIDGVSSEYEGGAQSRRDWFLYINGISCSTGAGDYVLRDGDVEHWDFRDWSHRQFIPAIIGDFPQPFLSGYQGNIKPTSVVYEEPFSAVAEAIAERLREYGVTEVQAVACDRLTDETRADSNLIIVALPDNELISELNSACDKLGFYAYLESGGLVVLDTEGNSDAEYGSGCGLIQATQNPWNPNGIGSAESAVWMVTGVDAGGVKSAARVLAENSDGLRHAFAAVISDGEVVKIP